MVTKAERRTEACFLREMGGKAGAGVESDSDPACGAVSGIAWVCAAITGS